MNSRTYDIVIAGINASNEMMKKHIQCRITLISKLHNFFLFVFSCLSENFVNYCNSLGGVCCFDVKINVNVKNLF